MYNILKVIAIILSISIFIYIVKNKKELIEIKFFKIILRILYVCLIIVAFFCIYKQITQIKDSLAFFKEAKKNNIFFDSYDKKIEEQNNYYNFCINKDYEKSYDAPYILNGFKHTVGEWNEGFVIEDKTGNEFVWIPISNKEYINVGKLIKKDFIIDANIEKEYCFDECYEKFIKSALENGGFYVSRYEVGIDGNNIVSKSNKKIYKNFTKREIESKIKKLYVNEEFNCELINGYAYDTTINWLLDSDYIEVFQYDVNKELLTGRNANKNIFDMFDNIFEYTKETSYDTNVIRGVIKDDFIEEQSRYTILSEENSFTENTILGARIIIYK